MLTHLQLCACFVLQLLWQPSQQCSRKSMGSDFPSPTTGEETRIHHMQSRPTTQDAPIRLPEDTHHTSDHKSCLLNN